MRLALKAPPPWAALLAAAGVLFLLHGARHRLVLAPPGGAVLGLLAARLVATALGGPGAAVQPGLLWTAAAAGAITCAAWPPIFPVLGLAIPGLLAGWLFPIAGRPWLGALAGGAVGGGLGALLREWVACLAAGGIGAAALLGGAAGLLAKRPIVGELAAHPLAVVAAWAVLTVAGAAFHAGRAWPPGRSGGAEPAPPSPDGGGRDGVQYDEWRG